METFYGNTVHTSSGSSWFYAWIDCEVSSHGETSCTVRYRYGVTAYGGWQNSRLQFDPWAAGASLGNTYEAKYPVVTEWWEEDVAYGSGLPLSCTAGYYASSGATRSSAASGTYRPETPVYAPNAVTGLSHSRVSDHRNSLAWANNPTTVRPYSSVRVERSVDGGAWSEVASVPGAATGWDDLAASANHSYSYRARPANLAGYGPYSAATGRTYNTPAAPTSVSAAVKSGTTVAVTVDNPALTATSLELQKSADGEGWADVAAVEGSPVTSLEADLGGGSFWLRARNARGPLKSAWTVSGQATVTECPPGPPTLLSPSSSQVVPTAATLSFSWLPSHPDGSAQTAAQVAYRLSGASSWTVADAPGASPSLSVPMPFAANSACEWRARTKGSHAGWGAWSAASAFSVRTPPQAAFEEPASGATVEGMPLRVRLSYVDEGWALAGCVLVATDSLGAEVYRRDMGASLECDVRASEWLPSNGASYALRAEVRSTSTLTATAAREVSVGFAEPRPAALAISPDVEAGAVSMTVTAGEAVEGAADAASASVYRVAGGRRVLLADNVAFGTAVVDRYAPVNVPYSYEAVAFAESGTYRVATFPCTFSSPYAYFMFGEGFSQVAKLKWDLREEWGLKSPEAVKVRYWGARYPTRYDTGAVSLSGTISGHLMTSEDWRAFERLTREAGGLAVYKSQRGDVFRVGAEASLRDEMSGAACLGAASVGWERVAGGPL